MLNALMYVISYMSGICLLYVRFHCDFETFLLVTLVLPQPFFDFLKKPQDVLLPALPALMRGQYEIRPGRKSSLPAAPRMRNGTLPLTDNVVLDTRYHQSRHMNR